MFGPEFGFHELESHLAKRQGQVQLPGSQICGGEVVHAVERVGMLVAEYGFPEL